jgi:hypothetical protein
MNNTVGRLRSLFPSHQFDVIVGSLLGDARLECRSVGVRSPITARFRAHHGFKQKEYVFWKYEILKNLVLKEPREISWNNPKRDLHEVSWYFHTKSLQELGTLYHYFYKNRIKILPESIFEILNPQMIAIWFMDDGSNNGATGTLNTHSFSMEDQLRIVDFFKNRFEIYATIVKDRNKFKIQFGRFEFPKLILLIQSYITPSMNYKIVYPRNDLSAQTDRANYNKFTNTSVPEWKTGKGIV